MNKQGIGLWIVVCALLVLDIGVHCVRAQVGAAPPKVLQVQELQVLDSRGHVAIDLTAQQDKSGVFLYDAKGRERVKLVADNAGGRLTLADENTHPQLMLDGSPNPSVTLRQNNNLRMAMQTFSDDEEALRLFDGAGRKTVDLDYKGGDIPGDILTLDACDPAGHNVVLEASDVSTYLGMGTDSTNIAGMEWISNAPPRFYLYDADDNLVWQKQVPEKGAHNY